MNQNEAIQNKLNEIASFVSTWSDEVKSKKVIFDDCFAENRYEYDLRKLMLDALVRYAFKCVEFKSKKVERKECFSIMFIIDEKAKGASLKIFKTPIEEILIAANQESDKLQTKLQEIFKIIWKKSENEIKVHLLKDVVYLKELNETFDTIQIYQFLEPIQTLMLSDKKYSANNLIDTLGSIEKLILKLTQPVHTIYQHDTFGPMHRFSESVQEQLKNTSHDNLRNTFEFIKSLILSTSEIKEIKPEFLNQIQLNLNMNEINSNDLKETFGFIKSFNCELARIIPSINEIDTTESFGQFRESIKAQLQRDENYLNHINNTFGLIESLIEQLTDDFKSIPSVSEDIIKRIQKLDQFLGPIERLPAINTSIDKEQQKKINLEKLYFLSLLTDVILVSKIGDFYDISGVIDVDNEDQLKCTLVKNFQGTDKSKSFHTEAKLATFCRLKKQDCGRPYIGVSKLCCPYCARFLFEMGFRFRGSHTSFENSRHNSTVMMHNENNNQEDLQVMIQDLEYFLKFLRKFYNASPKTCEEVEGISKDKIRSFFDFRIQHGFSEDVEINYCKLKGHISLDTHFMLQTLRRLTDNDELQMIEKIYYSLKEQIEQLKMKLI